jgi:hypothetical protein
MARYNTTILTNSQTQVTAGSTVATPNTGGFIAISSGGSGNIVVPDPTLYSGIVQTYFNNSGTSITLSTPSGVFRGPGSSGSSTQVMTVGTTLTLASTGTDYVLASDKSGGALSATSISASSTVTLSPANANVAISPTGTGTVTISPAGTLIMNPTTASSIDNTAIGATTSSSGRFTTLSASSTVSGTGFSTYLASPPAIGGTAAAAITGTTITANTGLAGPHNGTVGATTPASGAFTTLSSNSTTAFTVGSSGSDYQTGNAVTVSGSGGFSAGIFVNGTVVDLRPENLQTSNYTAALADRNKVISMNATAAAVTLTIPPNSSVPFPIGSIIYAFKPSTATQTVTLAAGAGVTLSRVGTFSTSEELYCRKRGTDEWVTVDKPTNLGFSSVSATSTSVNGFAIRTFTGVGSFTGTVG